MIKGIGIDLIELKRVKNSMEKTPRFINRILTPKEQEVFRKFTNTQRKTEYLAGRFAAKEAFSKACGTGIGKLRFLDIEVLTDIHGAPVITVEDYKDYRIFVSITHTRDYAQAQVIIEDN